MRCYFCSPHKRHARQDRQSEVQSDPAGIVPCGVIYDSQATVGPAPTPPWRRCAGSCPGPEGVRRGHSRDGNVPPWLEVGEGGVVHAIIAAGIRPSPDPGVTHLLHHYGARRLRLSMMHWLLGCGGRPVQ